MKITPYKIVKGLRYLKHYGPKAFWAKVQDRMEPDEIPYGEWYEKHRAEETQLQKQRKTCEKWENPEIISIVVPCYRTPEKYLTEMLESVRNQSYPYWELCLADATDGSQVKELVEDYVQQWQESRIVYHHLEENLGIAENTNAGLALAKGSWVTFMDHDDLLASDALYELASAIRKDGNLEILYTDEDKVEEHSGKIKHIMAHFKPDFSPDLLRSNNYITHLFCVKKEIIDKVGGFRKEFDGAQDYDFILRCTETAKKVGHVPRVLYHWRVHSSSTADNPMSKRYAYDAGQRAIEEQLKRRGIEGKVSQLKHFGFYKVEYALTDQPLVSILIPNKDEPETLRRCIESIQKTNYVNYEVIVIENNSSKEETFQYYEELCQTPYQKGTMCLSCEGRLPGGQRIKVVTWEGSFNYSAINNFGASYGEGEYFVLLNNDIEIITGDWLEQLLGNCLRPEVGIVGTRLYYPDHTYQHAGIVVGIDGIAANMFPGMKKEREGYLHKAALQLNYSAVTAAFLMIKRTAFEEAGGFEEGLAVAFNDVDLCLRVRKKGYLVVYDPFVEAYHYESKSRGKEDTKEKVRRFEGEIEFFRSRWIDLLKTGDPYYNPNLSLKKTNYALKPFKD
ncbi:MAG: glycosyltransferase family 2 protein [Lachnospiraceae bacterium]|nr:glycosyltransferase family 2 protein [Lachnospiraceae bacterium]